MALNVASGKPLVILWELALHRKSRGVLEITNQWKFAPDSYGYKKEEEKKKKGKEKKKERVSRLLGIRVLGSGKLRLGPSDLKTFPPPLVVSF